jgi:glutamyl-tRNA reductase
MVAIRSFVEQGLQGRRNEIDAVRVIVNEEVERYLAGASARQVAPVVTALRAHGDQLRVEELARFDTRLAGLSESQREAVELLTKQLVAKLLHDPTVNLKAHAGTVKGQRMADAVRALFTLGD